jgi:hypothetical protein
VEGNESLSNRTPFLSSNDLITIAWAPRAPAEVRHVALYVGRIGLFRARILHGPAGIEQPALNVQHDIEWLNLIVERIV